LGTPVYGLTRLCTQVDTDGLPLAYDRRRIQSFWDGRPGELQAHWQQFLGFQIPFLTKVATIVISSGPGALLERDGELARDARVIMEKLGPTYIKMGQMMSVRADVVGPRAMAELTKLQDAVPRFDTAAALAMIEEELGMPVSSVFSDISPEPVAAASLAQVYKATLVTGERVAVKVQRPGIRSVVSKDLYVLRRAAEVYQGLMDRLVPQQRTNYIGLLNEWAIGFYTELDFQNEARNAMQMRTSLEAAGIKGVLVPKVYPQFSSRRLLVTEWVDGRKLTDCSPAEIKDLTAIAQEAFLTQLLTLGFFHADPHPGNLLALNDTSSGYRLALLDFGLIARLDQSDMDALVSSLVHLANKDWPNLVDDFLVLRVLPPDTPRRRVEALMAKVLGPYVATGGGARNAFDTYGGLGGVQSLTQDLIGALGEVPFSLPPYFALLGRAVAVLEGIALQGDPQYRIVMSSFPFVSRKLLADDAPALQRALSEILYAPGSGSRELRGQRLVTLLSAAMNVTATDTGAFIDLDAAPAKDSVTPAQILRLLLSPAAAALRQGVLFQELCTAAELLTRQTLRRTLLPAVNAANSLSSPPLPFLPFAPPAPRVPVVLPGELAVRAWVAPDAWLDAVAPKLSQNEEIYAQSLQDASTALLGVDVQHLLSSGFPAPVQLQAGPTLGFLSLPVPSLAPLPAGVSADAAVAAIALAARAAAELRLPAADWPQARTAAQALQAGVRGLLAPSRVQSSQAAGVTAAEMMAPQPVDVPAELASTLAELSEQEARVLRDTIDRLQQHVVDQVTKRLSALS